MSLSVGMVQPPGSQYGIWMAIPLLIFGLALGILSLRLRFLTLTRIVATLLTLWFLASVIAAKFLNVDLLFIPVLVISISILISIHIKRLRSIDRKLTEKLVSLATSGYLMEGKTAEARVESGLKLLETVLPLSEVIVFQYEENGDLNPVGRTRNGSGQESMSARQNTWRKNVELCDKALKLRESVIEYDEENQGAARVALPLINENEVVGGLFVDIKENFESNDRYLLEAFSEQLARNFQRKNLWSTAQEDTMVANFLSTHVQENRINITNLINGLIKEQSFGVVATSYIKEAHAIAYLDGTIAYVNREMRHLAKFAPREVHETNLFSLLDRFKTDVFNDPSIAVRQVMQGRSTYERELQFPEDGITLKVEITLVKIATNIENVHDTEVPKKPACFLITVRDITSVIENEALRSDLVNMMSHELRTPITSIQGFAQMLMLDDAIPDEAKSYLTTIENESQRAANILSNFLSVANLQQSDKKEIQKSPVRMNKVVEEVVGNLKETAKRKRIRLVEKNDEYLPPIAADRGLLTKAISHLIDNAVRYSPERSSVIISTILESDFLRVDIEDRGYGIPPSEQEKIWNKFYRVAREGKDKESESTGLGLSLVKEIIEQHDGTIGVESEPGRGSKFSLRIPR